MEKLNVPQVLSKVRIRGVGDVIDSRWFDIGQRMTCFALPQDFNRTGFLRALQTIKPPYDCHEQQPFKDYPLITRQGKYQKRVRPNRRTIAFTIFTAEPDLVLQLSALSPDLYETDRIEVGRRMDNTRWINFVEIASSTRWSEVQQQILALMAQFSEPSLEGLYETLSTLKGTDRLKGELREQVDEWLGKTADRVNDAERRERVEQLRFIVQREIHFDRAKEMIVAYLPYFHIIDSSSLSQVAQPPSSDLLEHIISRVEELIGQEERRGHSRPILLFDEPSLIINGIEGDKLFSYVRGVSEIFQCLYLTQQDLSSLDDDGVKLVTLEDMLPA